MSEVRFYHLTRLSVQQALPDLLEKTLERGWRAIVQLADEAEVEPLNKALWTSKPTSFIPHGSAKDGKAAHQPVWLTAGDDNSNEATVLFLVGGAERGDLDSFDLVCDVFDGADSMQVSEARTRWKKHKEAGLSLTYWQQTDRGWEKKT